MSALLVKEAPRDLHEWLKDEAQSNRRSLNQQILICLEWCMQTYGKAQMRNPFAAAQSEPVRAAAASGYLRGRALASRLKAIGAISDDDAREMKASVRKLRASKAREFDYGCFASIALVNDCRIVTGNARRFKKIEGIALLDWIGR